MEENSTVALHKQVHKAAYIGDMETLAEMIAEDVVWHSPGRSLIAGDFHGRDTVFAQFFGTMAELSDGTSGFEDFQNYTYFGSGDHSAALFHWTATRNGKTRVYPVCEVIRWRNGQIAEEWGYYDDQYGLDAFWS
jgi:ketosteroid isomerase-like protein